MSNKLKTIIDWSILIALALVSVLVRFPKANENFYNADATYHVLLTMKAYDETPVSVHKFLPIVSLGQPEDKFIPWGATVPDNLGNYYYTSFSPIGFVVPYLFVKLFHLPINPNSLYIFNSILYVLSMFLIVKLFFKLFDNIDKRFIMFIAGIAYLFQLEIMHGQGIVYWHQSLFQIIFISQLILFERIRKEPENIRVLICFFVLCLVAPYAEWTGFCGNFGFGVAFFFCFYKKRPNFLKYPAIIFLLTVVSFALFCLHYLAVIPASGFANALKERFMGRSILVNASFLTFASGYIVSFGLLIIFVTVFVFLIMLSGSNRKIFFKTIYERKEFLIVVCAAFSENIILRQHSIEYGYDKMKTILLISFFLLCSVSVAMRGRINRLDVIVMPVIAALVTISALNLYIYTLTYWYKWPAPYIEENQTIARELSSEYTLKNSILAHQNSTTRGYANILWNRGIYENYSIDKLVDIANEKGKRYIVMLHCDGVEGSKINYNYDYYTVYDLQTDSVMEQRFR